MIRSGLDPKRVECVARTLCQRRCFRAEVMRDPCIDSDGMNGLCRATLDQLQMSWRWDAAEATIRADETWRMNDGSSNAVDDGSFVGVVVRTVCTFVRQVISPSGVASCVSVTACACREPVGSIGGRCQHCAGAILTEHERRVLMSRSVLPLDVPQRDAEQPEQPGARDFCIGCANGNDLPDGEWCRMCGRGLTDSLVRELSLVLPFLDDAPRVDYKEDRVVSWLTVTAARIRALLADTAGRQQGDG